VSVLIHVGHRIDSEDHVETEGVGVTRRRLDAGAGGDAPAPPPSYLCQPAYCIDDALRRLITDPDLRARLGQAARDRAVGEYGMSQNAARVLDVYAAARRARQRASGTATPVALP